MRFGVILGLIAATSVSASAIAPRQDDDPTFTLSPECSSKIEAAGKAVPTSSPELQQDALKNIQNICHYTPPASLKSQYSTYQKSMSSYVASVIPLYKSCLPINNAAIDARISSMQSLAGSFCSHVATLTDSIPIPTFSFTKTLTNDGNGGASQPTATGGNSSPSRTNNAGGGSTGPAQTGAAAGGNKPNGASSHESGLGFAGLVAIGLAVVAL